MTFKEFLKLNNHLTKTPDDGDYDAHTIKCMEIAFEAGRSAYAGEMLELALKSLNKVKNEMAPSPTYKFER